MDTGRIQQLSALQPGIHHNLPAPFYHSDPGASASRLKRIAMDSPLHCKLDMDNPPEPTATMILGTLVHHVLLEPNKPLPPLAIVPESFVVPEDYKPKTKRDIQPGEVVDWNFNRSYCKRWRDDNKAAGRIIAKKSDMEFVHRAARSIREHPLAGAFFDGANPEVSMFWNSHDGFRCKARLDLVPSGPCIVDIKKTANAKPSVFARHAINMGYHIQMAWYRLGWSVLGDGDRQQCILIAVEDDTADVTVHLVSEDALREGERLAMAAFDTWRRCQETSKWPGYSSEQSIIDLPPWHGKAATLEEL